MPSDEPPALPLRYPFPLGELGKLPPLIRWAQKRKPVCPVMMPSGSRMWMITRRDDIATVFADARFSRDLDDPATPRIAGQDITTVSKGLFRLDPPDHTRVKRVISGLFTRRAVAEHVPMITAHAGALLDEMAAGPNPTDLIVTYTARLQLVVMSDFLGVPPQLHADYIRTFPTSSSITAGAAETKTETSIINTFVRRVVAERRAGPAHPDDPIGALLRAVDEELISEQEMFGTAFLLFYTGSGSIVAPSTTGAMILMLHRTQLRKCLKRHQLWPRAIEEILRYYHNGVLGFPVIAREDVQLHDQTIRAGEAVVASMQAATWDTKYCQNPDKFNIHRSDGDASATFGAGPHYCLGSQFAHIYLQVLLRTLFERFPQLYLAIDEHQIPWRNDIMLARPACLPVSW